MPSKKLKIVREDYDSDEETNKEATKPLDFAPERTVLKKTRPKKSLEPVMEEPVIEPDSPPVVAPKRGRKKKERQPVVRQATAYNKFIQRTMPDMKKKHPDAKPNELLRHCAQMWQASKKN